MIVQVDERFRRIVADVEEHRHDRDILVRNCVNVLDARNLLQDALATVGDQALHFVRRCARILRHDDGGRHRNLRVFLTWCREDGKESPCRERNDERRRQLGSEKVFGDPAGKVGFFHCVTVTDAPSVSRSRFETATRAPRSPFPWIRTNWPYVDPASTGMNRTVFACTANTPLCPARVMSARVGAARPFARTGIETRAYIPGDNPAWLGIVIRSIDDLSAGFSEGAIARIVPRRVAPPSASTRTGTDSPAYATAPASFGRATSSSRALSFSSVTIGAPGPTTAPTSSMRAVTTPEKGARTIASLTGRLAAFAPALAAPALARAAAAAARAAE